MGESGCWGKVGEREKREERRKGKQKRKKGREKREREREKKIGFSL